MASLSELEARMNQANQTLQGYQDPGLSNQINQQISNAYSPSVKSATENVGNMMSTFLPQFMNLPNQGNLAGTSAADLDPYAKMAAMSSKLGEMGGQLSAGANYSNLLGGRLQDAQAKALQAMQFGYGSSSDAYNRAFQAYTLEKQMQDAAASRAAQARLQQMSMGGGTPNPTGQEGFDYSSIPQQLDYNEANKQKLLGLGAKEAGPMNDRYGTQIGYTYKLPNGQSVYLVMSGTQLPNYGSDLQNSFKFGGSGKVGGTSYSPMSLGVGTIKMPSFGGSTGGSTRSW